jgi:hypothetical protein
MLKFPVITGRLAPYRFYLEPKAGGIGPALSEVKPEGFGRTLARFLTAESEDLTSESKP